MKLSPKQSKIIAAMNAASNAQITLDEAVGLIGGNLYCNANQHVGQTLSRMVKRGLIVRVRPGVFRLPAPVDLMAEMTITKR